MLPLHGRESREMHDVISQDNINSGQENNPDMEPLVSIHWNNNQQLQRFGQIS